MGKKKRRKMMQQQVPAESAAAARVDITPGKVKIGRGNKLKVLVACLLVFAAAFLVYSNTLKNDFIWDDEYLILNNSQIKSFSHMPNVFKTYVGYGSENINNFYRPVQEISNMIDWFLWGEYPLGFHLTNTVLHALVSVAVFIFLFYLAGDILAAAVGALFYAVHPVHTEAVAYIAGRADSLYSLFMLLSLVFFIRTANRARSGIQDSALYAASIVCFILSLLSKEIIITMPLLVFLYIFFFLRGTEGAGAYRKLKWSWVPYAAIVVMYGSLRTTVLSFADIAPPSIFGRIPLFYRLLTFFRSILVYLRLLIFPADLHMERAIPISKTVMDPSAIFALVVIGAIVWLICRTYKTNRLISFALVWFFANLLPVSNIVPINSFIAEHWIYMASVGLFLLLGLGVARVYRAAEQKSRVLGAAFLCVVAVLIGVYARGTYVRNLDWRDEITFFNSTLKYHPRNARLYLNLGNTYYEKGKIDEAIKQYRKAIDINKRYAVAYGNIGSAYLHQGKPSEAEEYLRTAINIKHNYPIAHYNLGIVYFQRRKYNEALSELSTATEQLPQLYQAWNMVGRTHLKTGKPAEARKAFQRSLSIMPDQPNIRRAVEKIR